MKPLWFVITLGLLSSCTLIADLDRFEENCNNGNINATRTLQVALSGFSQSQLNQRVELRVVDIRNPTSPVLVAKAIIDGLTANEADMNNNGFSFQMPNALPPGPEYRMDLFLDVNGDKLFTSATDLGWSEPICSSGIFNFDKNNLTVDVDEIAPPELPGSLVYALEEMRPHVQVLNPQEFQLMLQEEASGRVVGFYRLDEVRTEDFTVDIPGIVATSGQYTVQFFADVDRDGSFSLPPDHSWEEVYQAGAAGVVETFLHNTDFNDLSLFK